MERNYGPLKEAVTNDNNKESTKLIWMTVNEVVHDSWHSKDIKGLSWAYSIWIILIAKYLGKVEWIDDFEKLRRLLNNFHWLFLKKGKNINSECYIAVLERLRNDITENEGEFWWIAHLIASASAIFSGDDPSDFFLFSDLQRMLAAKKLSEVIAEDDI